MDRSERQFWLVGSKRSVLAMYLVAFLAVAFAASAPVALAQGASEHCPGESAAGAPPLPAGTEVFAEGGSSGSITTASGATISWEGTQITITGGSVTFCVKSSTETSGIVTRGPGTYSTADFGLTNSQGQAQGVSHLVVYTVTTTTTTPPGTTTTPPGTTTTPPGGTSTSTSTPPLGGGGSTVSPTVLAGTETNTGSPSPLAFTGRDDLPWVIGAGLLLLLIGTLALRLGSKPAAVQEPTDWSA